jgi:hypothetical protein
VTSTPLNVGGNMKSLAQNLLSHSCDRLCHPVTMIKTKELGVVSFCILSGNWSDAGKEKIQRAAHQRDVE